MKQLEAVMIGIDTNILVRYLVNDDAVQSPKAAELINKYSKKESVLFINNIVLCELIWVLERGYKYSKQEIIILLRDVLSTFEFSFENYNDLWVCLIDYEHSRADFSDILIGRLNYNKPCSTSFTFDRNAASSSNFTLLD